MVYSFLSSIKCDYLYLVGDIIDVWALRKKWHWPVEYNEVIHKLLKRSRKGARVTFIPGNHDDFFRSFIGYRFGEVKVEARVIHTTADGRRLLVTHGDEFDAAVHGHRWLARLGDWAYGHLIVVNRLVNAVRRWMGKPYWSLSGAIKRKVKQAVTFLNNFEQILVEEARRQKVDGVICGHVHAPALRDMDGILYCNTGDWVEHCTALVEHMDGRLELIWWHQEMDSRVGDMAAAFNPEGTTPSQPTLDRGFFTPASPSRSLPSRQVEPMLFC
jgi:UDP-2,3-diacylglucosamine pyrophosphatase LpxH